jgi:hypothetical protein
MRYLIAFVCLFVFVCYSPKTLQGQTAYGTILGTITDASGAVVARANVTVTNLGTNVSSQVESGPAGDYDVPNLIPGKYQVTVEVTGFKKFVASDLVLTCGSATACGRDASAGYSHVHRASRCPRADAEHRQQHHR